MQMVLATGEDWMERLSIGELTGLAARKRLDLDAGFALRPRPMRRGVLLDGAPAGRTRAGGKERVDSAAQSSEHAAPGELAAWLKAVADRGDRDAFARLHLHFAPRLTGFLTRAGLTPSQAEDIVQETMFAVWRKAALYKPEQGGVATWIFVIARNLRVDMTRRKANRDMAPLDDFDSIDEAPNGEELVLAGEREQRLRDALGQLSAEQREVLRAAYFGDQPQSVIAERLGVPLGTVKSRMRLALSRLRKLIEDKP